MLRLGPRNGKNEVHPDGFEQFCMVGPNVWTTKREK